MQNDNASMTDRVRHDFDDIGERIMGPTAPWSAEFVDQVMSSGLVNASASQRHDIKHRMLAYGEALWHACARVVGKPCSCAACKNPSDPRHPWLIEDPL